MNGEQSFFKNGSKEALNKAEADEIRGMRASESHSYKGQFGVIAAIASPIAVAAGIEVLKQGGTAADAATTIAMTQITTQLGSVVSFAGIMSLVYYDKTSDKVYSLDAGYNTYMNEDDPSTIPVTDMGDLEASERMGTAGGGRLPGMQAPNNEEGDRGRMTLVPGFMAGFQAMHDRFGRLSWSSMFEPSIYYCENGVTINSDLDRFLKWRGKLLTRTPEGIDFLRQGAGEEMKVGDRFFQPELAKTLRAVAIYGANYMYKGEWAKDYVRIVQREGGKVTPEDLLRYEVMWSEPFSTSFAGSKVYAPGGTNFAGYNILPSLNLVEATGLVKHEPYWSDPEVFVRLTAITQMMEGAPLFPESTRTLFQEQGIDYSPKAQLTKAFAAQVAPLIDQAYTQANGDSHHSNSLVVIDQFGNVASITHTINSVVWGSTGIVVGGIPIPDSAGFQQKRLATMKPGDRLANEMIQTIVMRDGYPNLATAGIGSGIVPESLKVLYGVVGQGKELSDVQAAPPLLTNFAIGSALAGLNDRRTAIPEGAYDDDFLERVKGFGLNTVEIPKSTAGGIRGTVVAAALNPKTGERSTVSVKDTTVFGDAY